MGAEPYWYFVDYASGPSDALETPEFRTASPLPDDAMMDLFETTRPPRPIVEERLPDLLETMDRRSACYVILYSEGRPSEILFAGYSFA